MKVIYDREIRRWKRRRSRLDNHRYHVEQRETGSTWRIVGLHSHRWIARLQAWWWAHTDIYGRNVRIIDRLHLDEG